MSTESYVNRVSQPSIQEELKELLDRPIADVSAAPKPDWVGRWSTDPEPVSGTPDPEPNLPVPEADEPNGNLSTGLDPANALTSLIVSRVEFEKFRAQVVMALKHQGIDVRKYFPE